MTRSRNGDEDGGECERREIRSRIGKEGNQMLVQLLLLSGNGNLGENVTTDQEETRVEGWKFSVRKEKEGKRKNMITVRD